MAQLPACNFWRHARNRWKTCAGFAFYEQRAATGTLLASGSGSWTSMSDRNTKQNFRAADARAVLEKVVALTVQTWNYRSQDARIRHIGPMAQDFQAAFQVGESDTGISTVDADGVALAAIQGLNEKVEVSSQRSEIRMQKLEAENAELKQRLAELERAVGRLGDLTTQPQQAAADRSPKDQGKTKMGTSSR